MVQNVCPVCVWAGEGGGAGGGGAGRGACLGFTRGQKVGFCVLFLIVTQFLLGFLS